MEYYFYISFGSLFQQSFIDIHYRIKRLSKKNALFALIIFKLHTERCRLFVTWIRAM